MHDDESRGDGPIRGIVVGLLLSLPVWLMLIAGWLTW